MQQFPHMVVTAARDFRAVWIAECDALRFQEQYDRVDAFLFRFAQGLPPGFEFVGDEHLSHWLKYSL
jgi:hypothetical protein